jgi:hypothetical protein
VFVTLEMSFDEIIILNFSCQQKPISLPVRNRSRRFWQGMEGGAAQTAQAFCDERKGKNHQQTFS